MRLGVAVLLLFLWSAGTAAAGTVFLVDGRGWGHGVGMSQWGAEGYARHGYGYERILVHYYPGTRLAQWRPNPVRVLLGEKLDRVRVGSAAPFLVVDARGRKLHLPARTVVVGRRFLRRHARLRLPLRFEPGAQALTIGGAGYRGDVVVERRPGGLMAVNVLPLDRYLRGVVPWEVPKGWHDAAYKAQAVAARSYTLATLHPGADFDLYPDQRSQMYGGIRAERPETNLALGATAGQVLTWRGSVIAAFYFSTSGGKTSSVHDAWPRAKQVPYLVSVADPYDYISPHHVWPTEVLTQAAVARKLGVRSVRDLAVVRNSSGRAAALRVLTRRGWQRVPGQVVRKKLGLGSTDFDVRALSLDAPASNAVFAERLRLRGFVRGLSGVRLQQQTEHGWITLRPVNAGRDGRFAVPVRALASTRFRLAYNGIAGTAVQLAVAPRVDVAHDGTELTVHVAPSLPLRIERLVRKEWRPVARANGRFERDLRPGSYRVAVLGGARFLNSVSRPLGLR